MGVAPGGDPACRPSASALANPPQNDAFPLQEESPMRLSRPVALTALAAGLAILATAGDALAAPASVDVVNKSFQAGSVTVNAGEAVTWNWKEGGHDVAFQSGPEKIAASPFNSSGATWSHTFAKAGTYSYICEAHPSMKGTVTVVDAPAQGGAAPAPGAAGAPAAAGGSAQPVSGPAGPVVAGVAGAVDAAAPTLSKV